MAVGSMLLGLQKHFIYDGFANEYETIHFAIVEEWNAWWNLLIKQCKFGITKCIGIRQHQNEFCIILMSSSHTTVQLVTKWSVLTKEYSAMLNYVNKHTLSLVT